MSTKTVVVAKWQKYNGWADKLPNDWQSVVIQHGEELPNIGREPHVFLFYIIREYDNIQDEDELIFVQDNPYEHCPDFNSYLESTNVQDYIPLGGMHRSDANGAPHDNGLPVGALYEKWLNKPFPDHVDFPAGGQFFVRGRRVKQRNKAFYEQLFKDVEVDRQAWVAERLWGEIFRQLPQESLREQV